MNNNQHGEYLCTWCFRFKCQGRCDRPLLRQLLMRERRRVAALITALRLLEPEDDWTNYENRDGEPIGEEIKAALRFAGVRTNGSRASCRPSADEAAK